VELVQLTHYSDFKAIFTGILPEDRRDVSGQVVNNQGALGTSTTWVTYVLLMIVQKFRPWPTRD
jgi:hypothetical protein